MNEEQLKELTELANELIESYDEHVIAYQTGKRILELLEHSNA